MTIVAEIAAGIIVLLLLFAGYRSHLRHRRRVRRAARRDAAARQNGMSRQWLWRQQRKRLTYRLDEQS